MTDLSDFAERQSNWLQSELGRRAEQVKKEIPRPFGMVETDAEEQIQKYIDFRVGLSSAEAGDEQALQAIMEMREQFGLREMVEDILRVHPMFESQFKGETDGEES